MNRREILRALIDDRFDGKQSNFARAIKKSPAQVNQWLTGHRALGDAGARHIELTLGLTPGFFDRISYPDAHMPAPPLNPEYAALLEAWENLLPQEQATELERIKGMASHNLDVMQQLQPYRVVRVSDRRKNQVATAFPDRRTRHAKKDQ